MTCIEVQGLITPFINDLLDNDKLEEFINHINNCDDCKDELEVYYTLLTGMKQLDEDKNLSGNFHMDLINKIKKSEERLKRRKYYIIRKRIILFGMIIFVALFSSISLGEYVMSSEESKEEHVPLQYYFYRDKPIGIDINALNEKIIIPDESISNESISNKTLSNKTKMDETIPDESLSDESIADKTKSNKNKTR